MRRSLLAGVVILIGIASLVLVTLALDDMRALGDDLFGGGPPKTPVVIATPEEASGDDLFGGGPPKTSGIEPPEWAMEGPELPTLTAEEVARAKEILASDPRTQALPSGWSIEDGRVVVWVDEGWERIIGAGMTILLPEPLPVAAVKGSWSYLQEDPSAPHGYRVVTDEFTQEDIQRLAGYEVRTFSVAVDFERGEVVEFWPAYGQPWTWGVEGGTPPAASPEVPAPPPAQIEQD